MPALDRRTVLSVVAVPVGAVVALNLTFIAYALFVTVLDAVLPGRAEGTWVRDGELALFAVLVGLGAWQVLGSRLPALAQAIAMTVPLGVAYATIGIVLHRWPAVVIATGVLVFAVVLTQLRRAGRPWELTYALVVVSAAMLAITLTGTDI